MGGKYISRNGGVRYHTCSLSMNHRSANWFITGVPRTILGGGGKEMVFGTLVGSGFA